MPLVTFVGGDGISIHAAQEGCDFAHSDSSTVTQDFNPRSPRGLRRNFRHCLRFHCLRISIHAAQEGCDGLRFYRTFSSPPISIHAAQEGCDGDVFTVITPHKFISIHAAQEGCDHIAKSENAAYR